MAKSKPAGAQSTTPVTSSKKRPANEIDDLFNDLFAHKKSKLQARAQAPPVQTKDKGKGKGKAVPEPDSSSDSDDDDEDEDEEQPTDLQQVTSAVLAAKAQTKRATPAVIVDSSAQLDAFRNRPPPAPSSGSRKRGEKEAEMEDRFGDSRGTSMLLLYLSLVSWS